MTTIVIADDHRLFRQGLAALLHEQAGWQVIGEAGDGAEAVRLVASLKPDVVVLDVEMPKLDGIVAAREIRRLSPATHIVALSMYADAHYRERMRQAGVAAYVLKNEAIDELVDAVSGALRGEIYANRAPIPRETVVALRSAEVDKLKLSARELKVLRLLAEGKRTKEVAELLHISPKTVETYRARLINKLGIDNLSGLVRFAIRAGLISPES